MPVCRISRAELVEQIGPRNFSPAVQCNVPCNRVKMQRSPAHPPVSCSREIIPFVGPCEKPWRLELTVPRAAARYSPILYLGTSPADPDRPIVLYVARRDLADPVLANPHGRRAPDPIEPPGPRRDG